MKIVVCIDDKNGMAFNHRRQSKDAVLRKELLGMVGSEKLWMNAYSRKQFVELDAGAAVETAVEATVEAEVMAMAEVNANAECSKVIVDEAFLENAEAGDYCFVENLDILPYEDRIEEIVLYKWNRVYPADTFFALDMQNWNLQESVEFAGSSHEKITKEIYLR